MHLKTETGWVTKTKKKNSVTGKIKGGLKSTSKDEKKSGKDKKGKPPGLFVPPPEKHIWWQTIKEQIRFIMTAQGRANNMLTDAENVYLSIDPDMFNEESSTRKKSVVRSMWSKLTPIFMKYTPQIFNIKPPKSPEKNVQDWLAAMPEMDKCKTDSTVESLWWPTMEAKMTDIIDENPAANSTYVPRKDRKPAGEVDPLVKLYSTTTQLVPYKETSRSLVDLRTIETKRRNRINPKNRFSKNGKNKKQAKADDCINT